MNSAAVYAPRVPGRSSSHRLRGIDYHVSEWGEAGQPVVMMLHGWGDTGSCFQFLVDELPDRYHVIAPDWRGFGKSGWRSEAYWFPDYLADLDELLELYSPGAPVVLFGHSMGGNVAALYSGIMPERVLALVNAEGFGLPDSNPEDTPGHYRHWIETSRSGPAFSSYSSFEALAARIIERNPRLDPSKALFIARRWARRCDDDRVRVRADPAHRLPNAVQYRRAEARACWRNITAPTLLLVGEHSEFASHSAEWLRESGLARGPEDGAAQVTIADAGHMLHFEQPGAVAMALVEFLQSL